MAQRDIRPQDYNVLNNKNIKIYFWEGRMFMSPVLIVVLVIVGLIICSCIIHGRVIAFFIKNKKLPKAPKWHFWMPAKMRRTR